MTTLWYRGVNSLDRTTAAKKWLSLFFEVAVDIVDKIWERGGRGEFEKSFSKSADSFANLSEIVR
jgi:hypothetical protein